MNYFGAAVTRTLPPPSEYTNRVTTRQTRERQDHKKRISGYERECDISVSVVSARQKHLRESMLAYTERLKSIAKQRGTDPHSRMKGGLVGTIKPISKPTAPSKCPGKNRVSSLEPLLNRIPKSNSPNSDDSKSRLPRLSSERLSLPKLSKKIEKTLIAKDGGKVKVSLVSASDLCDIVEFSKKTKNSKDEYITENVAERTTRTKERKQADRLVKVNVIFPTMQNGGDSKRRENRKRSREVAQPSTDASTSTADDDKMDESKDAASDNDGHDNNSTGRHSLRRSRLKRMKLPKGTLDAIPEADSASDSSEIGGQDHIQNLQLSNLYLVNSPRTQLAARPKLDSIFEKEDALTAHTIRHSQINKSGKHTDSYDLNGHQLNAKLPPIDRLPLFDPKANFQDNPNPLEILGKRSIRRSDGIAKPERDSTKVKAQKKYRKLLFLRDSPSLYDRLD